MTPIQFGYLGTFVLGTLFGVILTVAIFRASVAVIEKRLDHMDKAQEKAARDVEWIRARLADVLLKIGAKRWGDEPPPP